MVDKLTMYNSVRKELLDYVKSSDCAAEITEWVWDALAGADPNFDAAIPEQDEEAKELFDECFAVLLKKIEDAIKE